MSTQLRIHSLKVPITVEIGKGVGDSTVNYLSVVFSNRQA